MSVVDIDRVTVTLGETLALAPVSVRVTAEQPLTVVGPNGSGKTTLLRVIAGLQQPTSGTVSIDGVRADERDRSYRAKVAALIGVPPLAHHLTLLEHLTLVGVSWGSDERTARSTGLSLLDQFGVGGLARRFPHELSSGQAQMFTLALTLARPRQVLLLDEPEQRLDSERVGMLASILRGVVEDGAVLVLSSHNNALIDAVGGAVLTLEESEIARGR